MGKQRNPWLLWGNKMTTITATNCRQKQLPWGVTCCGSWLQSTVSSFLGASSKAEALKWKGVVEKTCSQQVARKQTDRLRRPGYNGAPRMHPRNLVSATRPYPWKFTLPPNNSTKLTQSNQWVDLLIRSESSCPNHVSSWIHHQRFMEQTSDLSDNRQFPQKYT